MAFSVRVEFLSPPCTTPWLRIEPNWWDPEMLIGDPRLKSEPEIAGYDDYVAELTRAEFAELHERFKQSIPGSLWDSGGWEKVVRPKAAMLDAAIALMHNEWERVLVTVFEWDSGC